MFESHLALSPEEVEKCNFNFLLEHTHLPDDLLTAVVAVRIAIRHLKAQQQEFYWGKSESERIARKTLKADGTPTVPEDRSAQDIILSIIRKRHPRDGILAEENIREGVKKKRVWLVDGLDGTEEFFNNGDNFACSVGLVERGTLVAGAMASDSWPELCYAQRGYSSYAGESSNIVSKRTDLESIRSGTHRFVLAKIQKERQKHTSLAQYLEKRTAESAEAEAIYKLELDVIEGNSEWSKEYDERLHALYGKNPGPGGCETIGSAAIEQARVAVGNRDAYFSAMLKPWDAVGTIMVEQAGGCVTDWSGQKRDILSQDSILATNGIVHQKLVRLLKPCL